MATREEVLAYVDANGCTTAQASEHFGGHPSAGTIRVWLQRRRQAAQRPPPLRKTGAKEKKPRKEGGTGETVRQAEVRARARAALGAMPEGDRERIRKSRDHVLELIADREWVRANPKGFAAIMRGFRDLVTTIPEILAIDDRTGTRDDGEDQAELAAAFEVDPGAPVELRAVRGGGG